jgi:translation initiation factor 4A
MLQENQQPTTNAPDFPVPVTAHVQPPPKKEVEELEEYEPIEVNNFDVLSLKPNLLRGIYSYGFERPSPIQQKAIRPFTMKYDLIAQAQSGTGKTATFSIGLLQNIDETSDSFQGLTISPTRELAEQTYNVMTALSQYTSIRILFTAGGTTVKKDEENLKTMKPHIIVSTPGRILQLLDEGHIGTRFLRYLVMDEADVLLGANFESQVRSIVLYCSRNTQIGLYSATVTPEMERIIPDILRKNYVNIRMKNEMLTLEGITQYYVALPNETAKIPAIIDIFQTIEMCQLIVYCNSQKTAEILVRRLNLEGLPADLIHGKLDASTRRATMASFRTGTIRVLVCTDLLARGIDVQQVSLVINYDFPTDKENYLHRIGRSGRYGRKGKALNFIIPRDSANATETESHYQTQFIELPEDVKTALS